VAPRAAHLPETVVRLASDRFEELDEGALERPGLRARSR